MSSDLEKYFEPYRRNVVGRNQKFETPFGTREIIYADWTASARYYKVIEERLSHGVGPFIGNTHTETTVTGTAMTRAYHEAQKIIKRHVNAGPDDVILLAGSGMTAAVVKLQRILGFKIPEQHCDCFEIADEDRPVVFITHMEHHSNHTSWLETICDVKIIRARKDGMVDLEHLSEMLEEYRDRKHRIASVSACSNVTGIQPPVHAIARIMHRAGGLCFADYACSAPYVKIDMHPEDPDERFDAIFFSPHKFLGGPGSSGVLVFNSKLYNLRAPDRPGGGTVTWTNAWNEKQYHDDIEVREDGGTPPFMQAMRAAMCIRLKEEMGIENIMKREEELLEIVFREFPRIEHLHILEEQYRKRVGVISFYFDNIHYNLVVKLLNDRFGIQTRGGCACAGTYGHYLFYIRRSMSKQWTDLIDKGDLSKKPGWIRFSIHPTMTDDEVYFIVDALKQIVKNIDEWSKDYTYDPHTNEFKHTCDVAFEEKMVGSWFEGFK